MECKGSFHDTTLGDINQYHIIEPGLLDIGDEDSFYILYQNSLCKEVRFVICESMEHDGTIESIKKLIKNKPNKKATVYSYEYLSQWLEFKDVSSRMNELVIAINRDNKLNNILG